MNNGMPKIYFYIPSQELIDNVPKTIDGYWEWIDEFIRNKPVPRATGGVCNFGGPYNWTVQTFIYLRAHGVPCQLTASFPEEGIVITHRNLLSPFQRPSAKQFIVEIKPDKYLQCIFANFVIVQNKRDPLYSGIKRFLVKSTVVHNWPQPGLIPRDHKRGDRFENICFMGNPVEFIQETDALESEIKKLGLTWSIVPREKWHDYSEVDAIVAVRYDWGMLGRKPATRLTNAWTAGVPAIVSPDVAFEDIRKSDLDYLRANNVPQIIEQLKRLKEDASLRRAMSENGKNRAKDHNAEKTVQQWISAIQDHILPEYKRWTASPFKRMLFFPVRTLAYKMTGIDREKE